MGAATGMLASLRRLARTLWQLLVVFGWYFALLALGLVLALWFAPGLAGGIPS
jgi:hypothetical protein